MLVRPPLKTLEPTDEYWQGISASKGVAIGPAFLYTSRSIDLNAVESRSISPQQVSSEQASLRRVLEATAQELSALAAQMKVDASQAEAAIFEAQALMVQDPAFEGCRAGDDRATACRCCNGACSYG